MIWKLILGDIIRDNTDKGNNTQESILDWGYRMMSIFNY